MVDLKYIHKADKSSRIISIVTLDSLQIEKKTYKNKSKIVF